MTARRPRGSLNSQTILKAAFHLAEEQSVDSLSMPKLARHLDVAVTSLYWHYRSKKELLEAMVAEASDTYLRLLPFHPEHPWDEHVRLYFSDMKRILLENPVLGDLIVFRCTVAAVRPRLRFLERINKEVAVLIEAGFDPETAARAYQAFSVFTQGVVHRQRLYELSGQADARFMSVNSERIWDLQSDGESPVYDALESSMDYWSVSFASDEEFDAGLGLLIDGLHSRLPQC